MNEKNSALLTDLYELTMLQGYWNEEKADQKVIFDLFYRKPPFGSSFVVACGIEDAADYVEQLRFTNDDIAYLDTLGIFREGFLEYLKGWSFDGAMFAVDEGEVVAPHTPLIRVEGKIIQAQLIETALLNKVNFQTLIATKAARVRHAAEDCQIIEFGLRRAHGMSNPEEARAAYIGGCDATSNVLAGKLLDIPVRGTHAHSWIQSFPSEYEAFLAYARAFPTSSLFLVDTYDTLRSGVPNAIRVAREMRRKRPDFRFLGVRIDSGDLAYLTAKADEMLSEAGFDSDVKIVLSNDLDEHTIESIITQLRRRKAERAVRRLAFGVGTRLATGRPDGALGGVYKLVGAEENRALIPKIKLSGNIEKRTNPGQKKIIRLYSGEGALMDVLAFANEKSAMFATKNAPSVRHPSNPMRWYHFEEGEVVATRELLSPLLQDGKRVRTRASIHQAKENARKRLGELEISYRRLENPHIYKVALTERLFSVKEQLIREYKKS